MVYISGNSPVVILKFAQNIQCTAILFKGLHTVNPKVSQKKKDQSYGLLPYIDLYRLYTNRNLTYLLVPNSHSDISKGLGIHASLVPPTNEAPERLKRIEDLMSLCRCITHIYIYKSVDGTDSK